MTATHAVNRFHDPISGEDGPCSGSLFNAMVELSSSATDGEYTRDIVHLPVGMKIHVTDAHVIAASTTDVPSLEIGTASDDNALVEATNVTTGLVTLSLTSNVVGQTLTATRVIAKITNNTTSQYTGAQVSLTYYVSQAPTSVFVRGQGHF